MDSLYRPEALANAFASDAGQALHAFFPAWRTVMLAITVVVLLLVTLFGFVHYNEKVKVGGVLAPQGGAIDLPAPIAGTVVRVFHHEGDTVAAGEPLIEVSAEALEKGARSTRLQREAEIHRELQRLRENHRLQMRALDERYTSLREQRESLSEDRRSLDNERESLQRMMKLASEQLARWRDLASRRLIPAQELAEHESETLELAGRVQQLSRLSNANRRERSTVTVQIKELPAKRAQLRVELTRSTDALRQQLADLQRKSRMTLASPLHGIVATLIVAVGSSVQQGQILGRVVGAAYELEALLAVPESAPGEITVGDPVVVRILAFPYQRYGHIDGTVAEFSGTPLSPGQLSFFGIAEDASAPMYRVRVRLASRRLGEKGEALKPGMQVEADIVLQRRKLLDWLLEPLYMARERAISG